MPLLLLALVLLAFAGLSAPAAAQQEEEAMVRPFLEGGLILSTLHGDVVALSTVGAGLRFASWLEISGGGTFLLAPVDLGEVEFQALEMKMGWGGLAVTAGPAPGPSGAAWFVRSSVAVGNVDIQDRSTGLQMDSDNIVVLEPAVGLRTSLLERVQGRVTLGYRWVHGVEGLPVLSASDLRSFSARIDFLLGPF